MKTLYIDCPMGAAGDMLTAALLELQPDPDAALAVLNALGLPGVHYARETVTRGGLRGTRVCITVHGAEEDAPHHHHHHGLTDVHALIDRLPVSDGVKANARAVYERIAAAESAVHGVPVTQVHFHEVGALDAVADVAAVCLLLEALAPERIVVSPVHVGGGTVRCAHGILPVPTPATAALLRGVPICGGPVEAELCTPTGAALLTQFAGDFGPMPAMTPTAVGCGMGKKDFPEAPNCLRAFLGEAEDTAADTVTELSCNLDDMTPEAVGFAMERLLAAGALDVYTLPIGMKKCRPGVMLCVLCTPGDAPALTALLLRCTTTLGVRETRHTRRVLARHTETLDTPYGPVRKKISAGAGVTREKYEYADLARIAREQDCSLADAVKRIENDN